MFFRPDDSILRELAELHVVIAQESVPATKRKRRAAFLTFNQKRGTCFEAGRRNSKLQMAPRRVAARMSEAAVYQLQPSGS